MKNSKGKNLHLLLFSLFFVIGQFIFGRGLLCPDEIVYYPQELRVYQDSQILYNGRIWHKKHGNVLGNEFLFTPLWLKGDVIINGLKFSDKDLRYDIYNDELLIRRDDGLIISLNQEAVSGFVLKIDNNQYRFLNSGKDNELFLKGYAKVMYEGRTTLLLKSVKEILPLGYRNLYDIFYLKEYLYVMKDDKFLRVRGRKKLLEFLDDKREEIRRYIRINKIILIPKQPESIVPVLKYYDSLAD
jgi:hypothetical protein